MTDQKEVIQLHKKLRLDSPKTKQACHQLGVNLNDISQIKFTFIIRKYPQFQQNHVNEDVQKLRHQHYLRLIYRTIKDIQNRRQYLKRKNNQKSLQTQKTHYQEEKKLLQLIRIQPWDQRFLKAKQTAIFNQYNHQHKNAQIIVALDKKFDKIKNKQLEDQKKFSQQKKIKQQIIKQKIDLKKNKDQQQTQKLMQKQKQLDKRMERMNKSGIYLKNQRLKTKTTLQRWTSVVNKHYAQVQQQNDRIPQKLSEIHQKLDNTYGRHIDLMREKQKEFEQKSAHERSVQKFMKEHKKKIQKDQFDMLVGKMLARKELQNKLRKRKQNQQKERKQRSTLLDLQLKNRRAQNISSQATKNQSNYDQKMQRVQMNLKQIDKYHKEKNLLKQQNRRLKLQTKDKIVQQNIRSMEYQYQKIMQKNKRKKQFIRNIQSEREQARQRLIQNHMDSFQRKGRLQKSFTTLSQNLRTAANGSISRKKMQKSNQIMKDMFEKDIKFPIFQNKRQMNKKREKTNK